MIDFKYINFPKPQFSYNGRIQEKHIKIPISTASISSNQSKSSGSTCKYSFKTGGMRNIYTQSFKKQQSNREENLQNRSQPKKLENSYVESNYWRNEMKNDTPRKDLFQRSKSHNLLVRFQKPIPILPIELHSTKNQFNATQKNKDISKSQRKQQLYNSNLALKRSISVKKIHYQKRFSSLNKKVHILKNQFSEQQNKMSRIAVVIKQYFG